MSRFVLVFRGGMPKTPEEGEKMMTDWNAWMGELGDALIDPGAGLGKSRFLTGPGKEEVAGDPLSGYSVIEAADIEAHQVVLRPARTFCQQGAATVEMALVEIDHPGKAQFQRAATAPKADRAMHRLEIHPGGDKTGLDPRDIQRLAADRPQAPIAARRP